MRAGAARIAVFGEWQDARHGAGKRSLSVSIFSRTRCIGFDALPIQPTVRTRRLGGARAQERVIETTEPNPTTRMTGNRNGFAHILLRQRSDNGALQPPTPSTTTQSALRRLRECALYRLESYLDAFFLCGDVRGDRFAQRERIDRFVLRSAAALSEQRFSIFVAQTARRHHEPLATGFMPTARTPEALSAASRRALAASCRCRFGAGNVDRARHRVLRRCVALPRARPGAA